MKGSRMAHFIAGAVVALTGVIVGMGITGAAKRISEGE